MQCVSLDLWQLCSWHKLKEKKGVGKWEDRSQHVPSPLNPTLSTTPVWLFWHHCTTGQQPWYNSALNFWNSIIIHYKYCGTYILCIKLVSIWNHPYPFSAAKGINYTPTEVSYCQNKQWKRFRILKTMVLPLLFLHSSVQRIMLFKFKSNMSAKRKFKQCYKW